jgi:hypothetical protein
MTRTGRWVSLTALVLDAAAPVRRGRCAAEVPGTAGAAVVHLEVDDVPALSLHPQDRALSLSPRSVADLLTPLLLHPAEGTRAGRLAEPGTRQAGLSAGCKALQSRDGR